MSRAVTCKACFLKCDTGTTKHIFPFDEIWARKTLTTFGLKPLTTLLEMETECEYIHSKGNCLLFRMACLAKSYNASVVSYLTWKLGVTFFLITLYIYSYRYIPPFLLLASPVRTTPSMTLHFTVASSFSFMTRRFFRKVTNTLAISVVHAHSDRPPSSCLVPLPPLYLSRAGLPSWTAGGHASHDSRTSRQSPTSVTVATSGLSGRDTSLLSPPELEAHADTTWPCTRAARCERALTGWLELGANMCTETGPILPPPVLVKGRVPPFWHKTVFIWATPSQNGPVVHSPIFVSGKA